MDKEKIALVCVLLILLTGCSVGPKYSRPTAPAASSYKELGAASQWKTASPDEGLIRGNWWELFGDSQLNNLESMVNVSNQNVKQAEAQFRAARALVAYNRANYYPTIGAAPAVNSTQLSSTLGARSFGGGIFTQYSIPLSVSWEPNLWGRISLDVQHAIANEQISAADLADVQLSMQADLAVDYFQALGLDMESAVLTDTINAYERNLQLTITRLNGGVASGIDVAQARTQLENARAQLSDVTASRSQVEHAIAVLTGQTPSGFSLAAGRLPKNPPLIPVGLPSELLERRPDISAAERTVAASNAEIGLARVAYYPLVSINAGGGIESSSLTNLFTWPSRFWALGLSAGQTLFDFGRRKALTQQTEANYDATVAGYRQTVLSAFQEVEDQLSNLHMLIIEQGQQEAALKASEEALNLEIDRYKEGTASYLDVIVSQALVLTNRRAVVNLLQRRMTSAVQLIRAIGGGWDISNLP
jgi:NodT family efflux transporter outer membrane factor (OMF) lipoprotein